MSSQREASSCTHHKCLYLTLVWLLYITIHQSISLTINILPLIPFFYHYLQSMTIIPYAHLTFLNTGIIRLAWHYLFYCLSHHCCSLLYLTYLIIMDREVYSIFLYSLMFVLWGRTKNCDSRDSLGKLSGSPANTPWQWMAKLLQKLISFLCLCCIFIIQHIAKLFTLYVECKILGCWTLNKCINYAIY